MGVYSGIIILIWLSINSEEELNDSSKVGSKLSFLDRLERP